MALKKSLVRYLAASSVNPVSKFTGMVKKEPVEERETSDKVEIQKGGTETKFPTAAPSTTSPNPDGSINYTYNGKSYKFKNQQEFADFEAGKKILPEHMDAYNERKANQAAFVLDKGALPPGIENQAQLDAYNRLRSEQGKSKEEDIKAIAARESAKTTIPENVFVSSENPTQMAGFLGSSVLGNAGDMTKTLLAVEAAGLFTPAAPAAATALAVTASFALAQGFLASKSKTRMQDIATAKSASQSAQKFLNLYKAQASGPNVNKDELIAQYYEMKRVAYKAEAMLSDTEGLDEINVNEALDELAKLKLFLDNEELMDQEFFTRLYNSDPELYRAEIGPAMAAFEGGQ